MLVVHKQLLISKENLSETRLIDCFCSSYIQQQLLQSHQTKLLTLLLKQVWQEHQVILRQVLDALLF